MSSLSHFLQWVRRASRSRTRVARGPLRRLTCWAGRSVIEQLESRYLLATIQVTSLADDALANLADDGKVSLREAIEAANTNTSVDGSTPGESGVQDEIVFQAGLTGPIFLAAGQITIAEAVTIQGLGARLTTVNGQKKSRLFDVTSASGGVTFDGLTLIGGVTNAGDESGGAIRSATASQLTIQNCAITGNSTLASDARGGGIYAYGSVTVANSTISGNSTSGLFANGGGIYARGSVSVTNSTVSGNSARGFFSNGGGVYAVGSLAVTDSTVTANNVFDGGGGGLFLATTR